jgi:hypothetical protein
MTAPFAKRVRCTLFGHDWRRVIGPREGYYKRCRRCWISEQLEEQAEVAEPLKVEKQPKPDKPIPTI